MTDPTLKNPEQAQAHLSELQMRLAFLESLNRLLVKTLAAQSPEFVNVLESNVLGLIDEVHQTQPLVADALERYIADLLSGLVD